MGTGMPAASNQRGLYRPLHKGKCLRQTFKLELWCRSRPYAITTQVPKPLDSRADQPGKETLDYFHRLRMTCNAASVLWRYHSSSALMSSAS